ncbi:MAG: PEGA domain-containing protein [Methanomicrobiales archaeon]|nr:PEGA domain-containing protein [Methanomicrobiales archaeon]
MVREHVALSLFILVVVFTCVGPAAAEAIAVYGSTAGFTPELHADRFTVAYTIPARSGQALDANVQNMIEPSIDVIFIGGDDSFSPATAAEIEQAAWDGKILVITYPATGKFGDSLPFSSAGTAEGSESLEVADLENPVSRAVFEGLGTRFTAGDAVPERLSAAAKAGTSTLLEYSTGEPALAYRQYGNGYVIGWTLEDPSVYLGRSDADTVLFRLVTALLEARAGALPATTTPATPVSTPTTEATTVIPTSTATTAVTKGNVIIHSNPLGATVFLDGLYRGETPLEVSGITAGFHSLKMTMEGRYDYDGSVTAVAGETVTAFGSLPKQEAYVISEGTPLPATTTSAPGDGNPLASPVVIGGAITAAIGALVTIYTQKTKKP